jgi:hypothetical protein
MTTTSPDHGVRLGDVFDFEGVPRAPLRYCDTVFIPAMEIGLAGIAQLRKALDAGEPGIREYRARTGGEAAESGAGPGHAEVERAREDGDCGCGLGADRCRRAEDGDFND